MQHEEICFLLFAGQASWQTHTNATLAEDFLG